MYTFSVLSVKLVNNNLMQIKIEKELTSRDINMRNAILWQDVSLKK